jgi:hypothetical protein
VWYVPSTQSGEVFKRSEIIVFTWFGFFSTMLAVNFSGSMNTAVQQPNENFYFEGNL